GPDRRAAGRVASRAPVHEGGARRRGRPRTRDARRGGDTMSAATAKRAAASRSRAAKTTTPRILVLRAAGTNCDRETAFAFEQAGAIAVPIHVNEVVKRPGSLADFHGLVIPGGFSHGDDLSAGTVLGTPIRSRLVDAVRRLVD